MRELLLQVRHLTKHFPLPDTTSGSVRALDGVDFDLYRGECLGLVGESGSGKTTLGRAIIRALMPTSGQVLFHHEGRTVDLASASPAALRGVRRHLQMVFQDPYASLNPRMTVSEIIGEPLLIHGLHDRRARDERVRELLQQVGLQPHLLNRYPHAFSGGQRQRIGIARALALQPLCIIADEPVSALDVSVQAQVLNLLQALQEQLGLTYLFIAHDLRVVYHIADRIAVMYLGKIVELAPAEALFHAPRHPYTEALLAALPAPDPARAGERLVLAGEIADPSHPPAGCAFHPRCRYAELRCAVEAPPLIALDEQREVCCHRAAELTLCGRVEIVKGDN